MNAPMSWAVAAAVGFAAAWSVQALRWSESDARMAAQNAEAIRINVDAVALKYRKATEDTERSRTEYLEYQKNAKAEIADLERRVTNGPERLYIKAKCPAVSATPADASGTRGGAAELDAAATRTYFALERGLAEQYGLLQLCRKELRARSKN